MTFPTWIFYSRIVLTTAFVLNGQPLVSAADVQDDWKPVLDLNYDDTDHAPEHDGSFTDEFKFPGSQNDSPNLFQLDQPLPSATGTTPASTPAATNGRPTPQPIPVQPTQGQTQHGTRPAPINPAITQPNTSQQGTAPRTDINTTTIAPATTTPALTPTNTTPGITGQPAQNPIPTEVNPNPSITVPAGSQTGTPPLALDDPNKSILINFNNVNIIEFIRFISRASNKNFVFDDADLQFNVTIVSEDPTNLQNVMTALMQVLRVHGLLLIEQGNNIVIHRNPAISQLSQVVADGLPSSGKPLDSEIITRVFRLNTLDPEKAAAIIKPLTSDSALVEVLPDTYHLIVTDLATNVEQIGLLLKSLDAPNSGLTIGQYVVVNALLDSLIGLAEKVMEPIAEGKSIVFVAHSASNSVFVVSTPFLVDRSLAILRTLDINVGQTRIFTPESLRFDGKSAPLQPKRNERGELIPGGEGEGGVNGIGPNGENLNGTGIEGGGVEQYGPNGERLSSGGVESTSPWTSDLPAGHIERTKFYIHKLRYRKGDQIVDALGRVGLSLQESGTGNLDLISSIQSIQWLEGSNSLVFTGTISSIEKVKELIEEIDTPLRQVFIEMLILDTTLSDSLNFGVNFGSRFNNRGDTAGAQAFLSGANTLANALDNAAASQVVGTGDVVAGAARLARDTGYHLGIIGRNVTHCGLSFDSVAALVNALHDKTKREVIMNPKLLVEDNATAEIFVGVNTQFKTQSITNDQGSIITNNFEFRDVGTTLKVTPLISNNDIITMDILEEVESIVSGANVAATLDNQSTGPTTSKSKTTTRVHVPNKYFLVMSGMIQDEFDRRRQQVPCLGGAPMIGGLFSDKQNRDEKRNLMIFIRPQIVDTEQEIDDLTRHQQDLYRAKLRSKKMWKYEVEEALDLLNVKEPEVSLHDTEIYNP